MHCFGSSVNQVIKYGFRWTSIIQVLLLKLYMNIHVHQKRRTLLRSMSWVDMILSYHSFFKEKHFVPFYVIKYYILAITYKVLFHSDNFFFVVCKNGAVVETHDVTSVFKDSSCRLKQRRTQKHAINKWNKINRKVSSFSLNDMPNRSKYYIIKRLYYARVVFCWNIGNKR